MYFARTVFKEPFLPTLVLTTDKKPRAKFKATLQIAIVAIIVQLPVR